MPQNKKHEEKENSWDVAKNENCRMRCAETSSTYFLKGAGSRAQYVCLSLLKTSKSSVITINRSATTSARIESNHSVAKSQARLCLSHTGSSPINHNNSTQSQLQKRQLWWQLRVLQVVTIQPTKTHAAQLTQTVWCWQVDGFSRDTFHKSKCKNERSKHGTFDYTFFTLWKPLRIHEKRIWFKNTFWLNL